MKPEYLLFTTKCSGRGAVKIQNQINYLNLKIREENSTAGMLSSEFKKNDINLSEIGNILENRTS